MAYWLQLPRIGPKILHGVRDHHLLMRRAYVRICQRIDGTFGPQHERDEWLSHNAMRWGGSDPFEPEDFDFAEAVAACLFRLRFERSPDLMRNPECIEMRDFRPLLVGLNANFAFDLPAWMRFFKASYAAELRFATLMRERTVGLSRGSAGWCEALSMHAPALMPQALDLPVGVGLLSVEMSGRSFATLAVAALPDARSYPELSLNAAKRKP